MERLESCSTRARNIGFNLGVLLLTAVMIIIVVRVAWVEFVSRAVLIEPVQVPKSLVEKGMSPEA